MLRIDVLTLFPEMFGGVFGTSIIKRGQEKGLVRIELTNIRDYALDKHRSVDDRPYGGGAGMVMMCQPVFDAVEAVAQADEAAIDEIVLLTPQGRRFDQSLAKSLSRKRRVVLISGHYEGFDERIRTNLATMEISIGDYVLSGGELPAMVIVDAMTRLVPGVLGHDEATVEESFSDGRLEYPQYTRPADYRGIKVPEILASGDHGAVARWRAEQALARTQIRRPDMLSNANRDQAEPKK